jgi:hypothetical protein
MLYEVNVAARYERGKINKKIWTWRENQGDGWLFYLLLWAGASGITVGKTMKEKTKKT